MIRCFYNKPVPLTMMARIKAPMIRKTTMANNSWMSTIAT